MLKRKSNRIVEFDVLRGWFLINILINHIELYPNGFDYFTGRGRLFVSAAEGFFFMSGLLVGLVYKRRLQFGMRFIFKKMWYRALELYVGSVVLTLLFTLAAIHLKPDIKYGLPSLPINWVHTLKETFLMRYGFGWADFLDRFAILMLIAPFAFYLLNRGKLWLVVALSLGAWLFRGQSFTVSWQIIFIGGMVIGYHWQQLMQRWQSLKPQTQHRVKLGVIWLSLLSFIISYLSVYMLSVLNERLSAWPQWLQHLTLHWNVANEWVWQFAQKWTMGPLRIVLFGLWFWAMFMLVRRFYKPLTKYSRGSIELLGQNSLFVYIAHAFIVFIFKLFIPVRTSFGENFVFTAAALGCLIGTTQLYIKHYPRFKEHKTQLYQRLPWVPANIES